MRKEVANWSLYGDPKLFWENLKPKIVSGILRILISSSQLKNASNSMLFNVEGVPKVELTNDIKTKVVF